MSILRTLEGTASELKSQMGPMAGRVRETADDLIERLGTESRHLGEVVGERVAAQLDQLPDTALKRFNLVPTRVSRRRVVLGVIIGLVVGMVLMRFLNDQSRSPAQQLRSGGWDEREPASAGTGEGAQ